MVDKVKVCYWKFNSFFRLVYNSIYLFFKKRFKIKKNVLSKLLLIFFCIVWWIFLFFIYNNNNYNREKFGRLEKNDNNIFVSVDIENMLFGFCMFCIYFMNGVYDYMIYKSLFIFFFVSWGYLVIINKWLFWWLWKYFIVKSREKN